MRVKYAKINCEHCGELFRPQMRAARQGGTRASVFCCLTCYKAARCLLSPKPCESCGQVFNPRNYLHRKSSTISKYCSSDCFWKSDAGRKFIAEGQPKGSQRAGECPKNHEKN